MKQMALAACLLTFGILCLTGCATDDEPFPVHGGANSDVPVAGAATPAPGDSSAAWKW